MRPLVGPGLGPIIKGPGSAQPIVENHQDQPGPGTSPFGSRAGLGPGPGLGLVLGRVWAWSWAWFEHGLGPCLGFIFGMFELFWAFLTVMFWALCFF